MPRRAVRAGEGVTAAAAVEARAAAAVPAYRAAHPAAAMAAQQQIREALAGGEA